MAFSDLTGNDRVVVPEDERIFRRLVLDYAELGVHIILHLVVITVQMIGRYIQQDSYIRFEVVHVVQLKTAQFDHVDRVRVFGNLQCQAVSYVSCQADIHSGFFQDVVCKHGSRCLTITSGDTDHFRVGVSSGKFYFGDDMRPLRFQFLDHRSLIGYSGTFDDLVGIQNVGFGMLSFFPTDSVGVEHILILGFDRRKVGNEHVKSFCLRQHGCTCTAFSSP